MKVLSNSSQRVIVSFNREEWQALTNDSLGHIREDSLVDKVYLFSDFLKSIRSAQIAYECKEKTVNQLKEAINRINEVFWPLDAVDPILRKEQRAGGREE